MARMSRVDSFLAAFLVLLFAGQFWLASVIDVEAQTNCASHDVVLERLADGWGERVVAMGLSSADSLVEVWANLETGTWSVTVTTPAGPTCLVASGQGFELAQPPPGDPA